MGELDYIEKSLAEFDEVEQEQRWMGPAKNIRKGLQNNKSFNPARAIWELVQNARDVSDITKIVIKRTENDLYFIHNGNPFTIRTLRSLIIQVSSKQSNDINTAGQYGTGFLTTHLFGRKFYLTGDMESQGKYYHFTNFLIDRSYDILNYEIDSNASEEDILVKKLKKQNDKMREIINSGNISPIPGSTTFRYPTISDYERNNVKSALSNIKEMIPYVLLFNMQENKYIESIQIIDEVEKYNYTYTLNNHIKKFNNGLHQINIDIICSDREKEVLPVFFLKDVVDIKERDGEVSTHSVYAVMPIKSQIEAFSLSSNIPRLFFWFPLIGTEDFGFNYVVHSSGFICEEKRDKITLSGDEQNNNINVDRNQTILSQATNIIFEYLKNNIERIDSSFYCSRINFRGFSNDESENDIIRELHDKWVNEFKTYKLFQTVGDQAVKYRLSEVWLFESDILDDNCIKWAHNITGKYNKNLVDFSSIIEWSLIVKEWFKEDYSNNFLSNHDILKLIAENPCITLKEDLKEYYKYLFINGFSAKFDELELIPNLDGKCRFRNDIYRPINIPEELIEIGRIIIPNVISSFCDQEFCDFFDLKGYSLKEYYESYKNAVNDLYGSYIDDNISLPEQERKSLLEFYSLFVKSESDGFLKKSLDMLCSYYNYTPHYVENEINEKLDVRPTNKILLRSIFLDISNENQEWIKQDSNRNFVINLIRLIYHFEDLGSSFLKNAGIFLSQNDEFCLPADLKKAFNIPSRLKELYNDIIRTNKLSIETELVAEDFECYYDFSKQICEGISLAEDINNAFMLEDVYNSMGAESRFKTYVLEIIQLITSRDRGTAKIWESLFPQISERKAQLTLNYISDPRKQNSIFQLMGIDDSLKLEKLAELSQVANIDEIVRLGQQQFELNQNEHCSFQIKLKVGEAIQHMLQEHISNDICLNAQDIQNGQDIILYNKDNTPIYRIEVKTRWTTDSSVELSISQMRTSAEYENAYALIAINMQEYKDNAFNHDIFPDFSEYRNKIRVLTNIGSFTKDICLSLNKFKVDKVTISESYKAVVSQDLIKSADAIDYEEFIEYLKVLLVKNG